LDLEVTPMSEIEQAFKEAGLTRVGRDWIGEGSFRSVQALGLNEQGQVVYAVQMRLTGLELLRLLQAQYTYEDVERAVREAQADAQKRLENGWAGDDWIMMSGKTFWAILSRLEGK
jgi:hypothetical protein